MLARVRHLPIIIRIALAAGASLAASGCGSVRMPKLSLKPSTPANAPVAEDPALAQARAEHAEARRRVAELERRVVESEERLRVAQVTHDGLRDQYFFGRAPAPGQAMQDADDEARRRASETDEYRALVAQVGEAAQALENHGADGARPAAARADAYPPELLRAFSTLSDLMFAMEVQAPDAQRAAQWDRAIAEAMAQIDDLRQRDPRLAARADAVMASLGRVHAHWAQFEQQRAAAASRADEQTRAQDSFSRSEAARPVLQRAQRAVDEARRALEADSEALRDARLSSASAREQVERLERQRRAATESP